MYELKRSKKIKEQIKVGDEVLEINLDVGNIQSQFIKKYNEFLKFQTELISIENSSIEETNKKLEQYGNAVVGVLDVIFGDNNTQKILRFYENNYIEMFTEICPFIAEVIIPKISEEAKRKAEELKELYKRNKR